MSEIPPVFISYPRDESSGQALAREIYQRLEDEGIPAFLDEHNIRLGDRWIRTLSEGVEHCKIMLSVVSPKSHDRPWVEKEYIAASGVDALIIPVIATEGKLPMQINDLQAARLYGETKEAQWMLVLGRIREELPGPSQHQVDEALAQFTNRLGSPKSNSSKPYSSEIQASQAAGSVGMVINNFSGITLEQHEDGLLRQEKRLRQEFREAANKQNSSEKKTLKIELDAVQNKLLNLQDSYQEMQKRFSEADAALEQLNNELPEAQIQNARVLLAKNETLAAKEAFTDIVENGSSSMASAAYESGRLEQEDVNYGLAMKRYSLAASLENDNREYLSAAGKMAYIVGEYSTARDWFSQLLKNLGSGEPDYCAIATCKFDLAILCNESGEYTKAESLFEESLRIHEVFLGEDHPTIAVVLNNFAEVYRSQSKYEKAEPLYLRSIAIHKNSGNDRHPEFANTLNNLAELYRLQSKNAEAEPLYKASLSIYEESLGENHPYFATSLNNLALLSVSLKKFSEAESLFLRAITTNEKALGKNHHVVANSLNNLASLYRLQGQPLKAEPLYLRDLYITERSLGTSHPDFATTLNNLGELYRENGRFKESESFLRRALGIYEKSLGKDHPDVATALSNLALVFNDRGKKPASIRYLQRAINIWEKKLPVTAPRLVGAKEMLKMFRVEK